MPAPQDDEGGGGRGAPHGTPAMMAAAQARVERSRESMERIARDLGIRRETLHRWKRVGGWTRPARDHGWPWYHRSSRFGFALCGEAVSTARELVIGSNLSARAIARRLGVSQRTVLSWIARGGWTRAPAVAARYPSRPRHAPATVAAAREWFETTWLPAESIGRRVGCCGGTVWLWARKHRWTRPPRR